MMSDNYNYKKDYRQWNPRLPRTFLRILTLYVLIFLFRSEIDLMLHEIKGDSNESQISIATIA